MVLLHIVKKPRCNNDVIMSVVSEPKALTLGGKGAVEAIKSRHQDLVTNPTMDFDN